MITVYVKSVEGTLHVYSLESRSRGEALFSLLDADDDIQWMAPSHRYLIHLELNGNCVDADTPLIHEQIYEMVLTSIDWRILRAVGDSTIEEVHLLTGERHEIVRTGQRPFPIEHLPHVRYLYDTDSFMNQWSISSGVVVEEIYRQILFLPGDYVGALSSHPLQRAYLSMIEPIYPIYE